MTSLLLLFYEFFKVGLFAIGGGMATLPFLFNLSDRYPEWLSYADISNMIAVSESTPGPMGVNMATFAGNNVAGILGGIVATLGLVAPSIIIILVIARILDRFKDNKYVNYAFYGLRAVVIALIAYAGFQVFGVALYNGSSVRIVETAVFAVLFAGMLVFKKVHPILWIVIAAAIGLLLKLPSC